MLEFLLFVCYKRPDFYRLLSPILNGWHYLELYSHHLALDLAKLLFWHILHIITSKKYSDILQKPFISRNRFLSFRNVISTYSSGTGGAGIIGSFSYAALIAINISPVNTMLLMLCVPLLEGVAFWIFLRNPQCLPRNSSDVQHDSDKFETFHTFTLGDKIRSLPRLLKYMIPLTSVFFLEYFINQGLVSDRWATRETV